MITKNVLGICSMQNAPHLGEITMTRPAGVLSFLGRYALMDFTLSNFANSNINAIGLLVRSNPRSVLQHIGTGATWINNTKTGFFALMYNEKGALNQRFNTDIANIKENYWVVKRSNPDYIVIAPSHVVCTIDYEEYLERHIENGADVSTIYVSSDNLENEYITSGVLTLDENNNVIETKENTGKQKSGKVMLDMHIINRDTFELILKEYENISLISGVSEIIKMLLKLKKIRIFAQEFTGYVHQITTLSQYFNSSLSLLDYKNRVQLFKDDYTIYTTTHDTPPSRYLKNAKVKNSFIANGSYIDGQIENSIISRDVSIADGAKIKNCIIFSGAEIGSGVELENVIVDKGCNIGEKQKISGTKEDPVYIRQGALV